MKTPIQNKPFLAKTSKAFVMALTAMIIHANAVSTAKAGADRAGNGGDFDEMEFTAIAYEVVDSLEILQAKHQLTESVDVSLLKKKLRSLRVRFVSQPQAGQEPRSAVNYPAETLIEVDRAVWKNQKSKKSKVSLVTHELLPLAGTDDRSYKVSAPLIQSFEAARLIRDPQKVKIAPVLLDSLETSGDREGYSFEDAQEFCERTRDLNRSDYFFVYCTYIDKQWEDTEWVPVADIDSRYLIEIGNRFNLNSVKHIRHHSIPVTVQHDVYNVKVYGLGLLSELPFQVVAGSAGLAGGLIDLTFATHAEAMDACRNRLRAEAGSVLFHRATCRTLQNESTGEYLYEIVTQNPLYLKK